MNVICQTSGKSCLSEWNLTFHPTIHEFKHHMTLKIHVIYHHYSDYFSWTKTTMRLTNGEFTETTHSPFKISERIYGFKVNRIIGTPVHEKKSLQSLVSHNSGRQGLLLHLILFWKEKVLLICFLLKWINKYNCSITFN